MTLRLAALMSILFIAGCSLHNPTKVTLPVEPPAAYLEGYSAEPGGLPVDQWWQAFNDDHLNLLMTEMFAHNLELVQSFARLDQVESVFRITRSAQLPALSAGGNVSRSRQPGVLNDFTGDSRQLSLAAGFELDLWGKLAAQSQAASLEQAASRQDVQTLYLGLSARLADLYFLAVEQRSWH